MQKYVLAGIFILSIITGAVIYQRIGSPDRGGSFTEVDWRLLGEMDYITGKASGKAGEELTKLNGQKIKIPGFMVPLEDSQTEVTEFLLVPSPQACIHVPPPPPNQMVYVKMKKESHTQVASGPIWVYGQLNLVPQKSMYGEASFELVGEGIEIYQ